MKVNQAFLNLKNHRVREVIPWRDLHKLLLNVVILAITGIVLETKLLYFLAIGECIWGFILVLLKWINEMNEG